MSRLFYYYYYNVLFKEFFIIRITHHARMCVQPRRCIIIQSGRFRTHVYVYIGTYMPYPLTSPIEEEEKQLPGGVI